ncbi:LysM peptidoglycan-binding domain-containing protein [Sandaracinobacter neustonicus]|uniref:LysM peptidoglycan-binding domain-containing protein n=1 Tax=Sandaracinobacter neustonicus TaxID=1715348 RepID=A0A501XFP9_9SPHN|nr:M48 family metalloprotease [Sandaracinobacter neustonicus]TPE59458.1 LysM peptidoglycan-binding domain-containing protein [Sandaracinobacter neustonicus]
MLRSIGTMARAVLAASLLAVAAVPAQAQRQPQALTGLSQKDRQIGAQANKQIVAEFGGAVDGPLADYVRVVGTKIGMASVPGSTAGDWKVTVLNSPVPNAMATPGGYIYITRGLLAMINNEAELASVLGHEAGHVAARHSDKRQGRAVIGALGSVAAAVLLGGQAAEAVNYGAGAWVAGFSRSQESQADTLGMRYAILTGYDPRAAASMLEALDRVAAVEGRDSMERGGVASVFSTHPVTAERVQRVARQAAQTGVGGALNREAYLAAIDGMRFGDSPDQGIISGSSFRHASLGLAFDAPQGFQLQNSPQAVGGRAQDGSQFIFTGVKVQPGQSLQSVAQQVWQQTAGQVPQASYSERRINNFDAGLSEARLSSRQGMMDVGVHVFRVSPQDVYVIRTIAPAGRGAQFQSLISSFRRMSVQEAQAASQGRRIDVITVRPGDSADSLARRMSPPYNRVQSFLALNGIANRPLQPGEQLKIIVN